MKRFKITQLQLRKRNEDKRNDTMPQLTLEFSANIMEKAHLIDLLNAFHQVLSQQLPTELSSCKSRAMQRDIYCVGDGSLKNAFVHVNLKVKPGRSTETLQAIGQKLMDIMHEYFNMTPQEFHMQLSLEIEELSSLYFKHIQER